jgi:hypothetical protein
MAVHPNPAAYDCRAAKEGAHEEKKGGWGLCRSVCHAVRTHALHVHIHVVCCTPYILCVVHAYGLQGRHGGCARGEGWGAEGASVCHAVRTYVLHVHIHGVCCTCIRRLQGRRRGGCVVVYAMVCARTCCMLCMHTYGRMEIHGHEAVHRRRWSSLFVALAHLHACLSLFLSCVCLCVCLCMCVHACVFLSVCPPSPPPPVIPS